MKGNALRLAVLAFAFIFAATMSMTMVGGAVAKSKSETMTIVGKVQQGKILADDGKEYMVADNAKGKELMKDHMGHKVEVKGKVSEKNGQQKIVISSIKHLSAE